MQTLSLTHLFLSLVYNNNLLSIGVKRALYVVILKVGSVQYSIHACMKVASIYKIKSCMVPILILCGLPTYTVHACSETSDSYVIIFDTTPYSKKCSLFERALRS